MHGVLQIAQYLSELFVIILHFNFRCYYYIGE